MSRRPDARALIRYAAKLRGRRRAARREVERLRGGDLWREEGLRSVNRSLIADARERLPPRAGPFHKGALTLNALSEIATRDPGAAALLVERFRRLLQLRREVLSPDPGAASGPSLADWY